MKTTLAQISFWKYTDLIVQVLAFAVMLFVMGYSDQGPFAFFLEAGIQVISCLAWSFYFRSVVPKYRAGVFIRRTFLVVLTVWIILSLCPGDVMVAALYLMLLLGPLLGLAYFVITALEAGYYGKARRPFYLL